MMSAFHWSLVVSALAIKRETQQRLVDGHHYLSARPLRISEALQNVQDVSRRVLAVRDRLVVETPDLEESLQSRRISRAVASLQLQDFESLQPRILRLSEIEPSQFAESYGRLAARIDGVETLLNVIGTRHEMDRNDAEAALDLLASKASDLFDAVESLDRIGLARTEEATVLADAQRLGREIVELRANIGAAASELGLDVQQLNWG